MRSQITLIFFIILYGFQPLLAQQSNPKVDSLLNLLSKAQTDATRAARYIALAGYYDRTEPQMAVGYLSKSLESARKSGVDSLIADALAGYGYHYYQLNMPDSAAAYWSQSIDIYSKIGSREKEQQIAENLAIMLVNDRKFEEAQAKLSQLLISSQNRKDRLGEARILSDFGLLYDYMGNYPASLDAYQKSNAIFETIDGTEQRQAHNWFDMGVINALSQNNQLAKTYYYRALGWYEKNNMAPDKAKAYGNLGNVYEDLGMLDSAVFCQKRSYELAIQAGATMTMSYALTNLGSLQYKLGQQDSAWINYHRSLALKKSIGDTIDFCASYIGLSNIMLDRNALDSAYYYAQEAYNIALDYGDMQYQCDAAQALSNYFAKKGKFQDALAYYKEYKTLSDTLVRTDEITQLELGKAFEREGRIKAARDLAQVEADKKKAQIRLWQISVLAATGLAGLLFFFFYRTRKQKNLLELLYKELQHRTKNYLQILGGIFTLQSGSTEDAGQLRMLEESRRRVDAMKMLEQKLLASPPEAVLHINAGAYLSEIVDSVAKMLPEHSNFVFKKDLEPLELDATQAMSVGIILNELLTNALKHAAGGNAQAQVSVSLRGGAQTTLVVEDNGAGLPPHFDPEQTGSFGLKLVNLFAERLGARMSVRNAPGARFEFVF